MSKMKGFRRWCRSMFTCGPRWTLRHLKPFGGLRPYPDVKR